MRVREREIERGGDATQLVIFTLVKLELDSISLRLAAHVAVRVLSRRADTESEWIRIWHYQAVDMEWIS